MEIDKVDELREIYLGGEEEIIKKHVFQNAERVAYLKKIKDRYFINYGSKYESGDDMILSMETLSKEKAERLFTFFLCLISDNHNLTEQGIEKLNDSDIYIL